MSDIRYKIVITQGCTSGGISINDKREGDMSPEEMEIFIDYLLFSLKNGIKDGSIQLSSVIETIQYSDYEHEDGTCEQCGDSMSWTTYEI